MVRLKIGQVALTVAALGAATALALDDARLAEIDAAASNTEIRIQRLGDGGDTNELALLTDKLTRARNVVIAERRKRYMVGGNLPVPSFDSQLDGMVAQFEAAAARLQAYDDQNNRATNPSAARTESNREP